MKENRVNKDRKKKTEPNSEKLKLFFGNQNEVNNSTKSQQINSITSLISSSIKEENSKKLNFSKMKIDENLIEKDINYLNQVLDEEIKKGNILYCSNFKKTLLFSQIQNEVQNKTKSELFYKCYLLSILETRDPKLLVELSIKDVKEKLEKLKKREESTKKRNILQGLELLEEMYKGEDELLRIQSSNIPFLYIGSGANVGFDKKSN